MTRFNHKSFPNLHLCLYKHFYATIVIKYMNSHSNNQDIYWLFCLLLISCNSLDHSTDLLPLSVPPALFSIHPDTLDGDAGYSEGVTALMDRVWGTSCSVLNVNTSVKALLSFLKAKFSPCVSPQVWGLWSSTHTSDDQSSVPIWRSFNSSARYDAQLQKCIYTHNTAYTRKGFMFKEFKICVQQKSRSLIFPPTHLHPYSPQHITSPTFSFILMNSFHFIQLFHSWKKSLLFACYVAYTIW